MPSATPGARLGRAAATLLRSRRTSAAVTTASAAAAGPQVRRALGRSGRHLLGSLGKAFGRLGLQLAGVMFLGFALAFGAAGVHGWRADHAGAGAAARHPANLTTMAPRTEVEWGLALLFTYFGLSSLLRAGERP